MPTGLWLYAYYVFVALIVLEALLMIAVLRQITALHSHFVTNDRMTLTQDFPWVRWREQVNALNAALRGHYAYLRHCRKLSFPAKGPSGGRTLPAQNAMQPELG